MFAPQTGMYIGMYELQQISYLHIIPLSSPPSSQTHSLELPYVTLFAPQIGMCTSIHAHPSLAIRRHGVPTYNVHGIKVEGPA